MRLLAFCEATADFRLTSGLVDRMLRELGPSWVADNGETPEVFRTWSLAPSGQPYFKLGNLNKYMDDLDVRTTRGHFNGQPGGAGSSMMRKALNIARAVSQQQPHEPIEAVVLVWDMDQQPEDRRAGVKLARDDARSWAPFKIVCGFQDPEREAWLLAGFDPCDETEHALLAELHEALGFSPVLHAARLRDKAKGALQNIKRVLGALIRDDASREERCWTEPPLKTLRDRGGETGLSDFLEEIERILLPLLDPSAEGRHRRT